MAKCACSLVGEGAGSVTGLIRLSQASENAPTVIEGEIKGLAPGKHGISINVYGDLTLGLAGAGRIFNPFGKRHIAVFPHFCRVSRFFFVRYKRRSSVPLVENLEKSQERITAPRRMTSEW